jgi:hypothetical protein
MVPTTAYNTQDYWVIGLSPWSGILKKTAFRKLDVFPSSWEWEAPALLVALETSTHWTVSVTAAICTGDQVLLTGDNRIMYRKKM